MKKFNLGSQVSQQSAMEYQYIKDMNANLEFIAKRLNDIDQKLDALAKHQTETDRVFELLVRQVADNGRVLTGIQESEEQTREVLQSAITNTSVCRFVKDQLDKQTEKITMALSTYVGEL